LPHLARNAACQVCELPCYTGHYHPKMELHVSFAPDLIALDTFPGVLYVLNQTITCKLHGLVHTDVCVLLLQHKYTHKYTHTYTHTHESSHTLILQGKKKKLNNLVCEMGAWCMVMTDEQVSQFLRDGEALWELTQTEPCRPARLLHHGKLLHRTSQSIPR